jgi:preprotein translocase subunit SecD
LVIGLVLNLFTAIVVTRVFLNLVLGLLGERSRNINMFGQ